MTNEDFTNSTTPIRERQGGEMVWLPLGEKGSLITFGGTPVDLWATLKSWMSAADKKPYNQTLPEMTEQAQGFMDKVHVYDIASKKWYDQTTTGNKPPPTSDFCSVVASSQDGTSHHVCIHRDCVCTAIDST